MPFRHGGVQSCVKLLRQFSDLELRVTTETGRPHVGGWEQIAVLTANVVGTDGMVREERHAVEFARLRITKRSVQARWLVGHVPRPTIISFPNAKNHSPVRTMTVPRVFTGPTARKTLSEIRHRMALLLAPQHGHLFGQAEAKELCAEIHGYIVVNAVMTS